MCWPPKTFGVPLASASQASGIPKNWSQVLGSTVLPNTTERGLGFPTTSPTCLLPQHSPGWGKLRAVIIECAQRPDLFSYEGGGLGALFGPGIVLEPLFSQHCLLFVNIPC